MFDCGQTFTTDGFKVRIYVKIHEDRHSTIDGLILTEIHLI